MKYEAYDITMLNLWKYGVGKISNTHETIKIQLHSEIFFFYHLPDLFLNTTSKRQD